MTDHDEKPTTTDAGSAEQSHRPLTDPLGSDNLSADELRDAAAGLEGWEAKGTTLTRDLSAGPLDAEGLQDTLRTAAAERGRELDVRQHEGGVTIILGADQPVTHSDLELASELDAVIVGTAPTPGTQDVG